jgi:hypothetical protein
VWASRGYAVVTSGGLSAGSTDFELDVGQYTVLTGGTAEETVGPTTLSVNAPTSDPYWLVVYVDSGGSLGTAEGSEGAAKVGGVEVDPSSADVREIHAPAPPTLSGTGPVTVLGRVLVTSEGVSDSLIDDRVFGSEFMVESLASQSVVTDALSNGVAGDGNSIGDISGDTGEYRWIGTFTWEGDSRSWSTTSNSYTNVTNGQERPQHFGPSQLTNSAYAVQVSGAFLTIGGADAGIKPIIGASVIDGAEFSTNSVGSFEGPIADVGSIVSGDAHFQLRSESSQTAEIAQVSIMIFEKIGGL